MPVQRFKTFADAREALWFDRDDPRLLEAIAWVWALARRFSPLRTPPGVYRFRGVEDANRSRDRDRR